VLGYRGARAEYFVSAKAKPEPAEAEQFCLSKSQRSSNFHILKKSHINGTKSATDR